MYTNLTKSQAFPMAAKISSQPRYLNSSVSLKVQSLPYRTNPKPSQTPLPNNFNLYSIETSYKAGSFCLMKPINFSTELGNLASPRRYGLLVRNARQYCLSIAVRSLSSSVVRPEKQLPWLASNKDKEVQDPNIKCFTQEESTTKVKKERNNPLKRSDKGSKKSSWEESIHRLEKATSPETGGSSWEASAAAFSKKSNISASASKESRKGLIGRVGELRRNDYSSKYGKFDENDDRDDDELEDASDDPRWDNIKNRFKGMVDAKGGSDRPEVRRWNRQENWGRKTWKEATQSTLAKIIGEGIYGVGPVLAALSAGRREFYALYVQEGLDLSSNNRKKKDKKGFEKVLKIAEKVGLSIKEASKHDLNMVTDNRPHQGLVLDASPLEMVKIMELDPLSVEEGKGSLWVALDEVTDPQNLGAIIRSAYFFGASGVVLCAKNSAPLSGVVSKASAGSLELMEIRYCKNMMQFLQSSAENGWRVLGGSVSSGAASLNEIVPGPPTILVLGSEGTGLRPLVERSCTQLVRILSNFPVDLSACELDGETTSNSKSSGREFQSFLAVESLNVSVAAGVLLHHLIGKKSLKNHCQMDIARLLHLDETP